MDLEKRVSDLETLVHNLISKLDKEKFYSDADTQGIRQTSGEQGKVIGENTEDISDVRTAIEEVYEMIDGGN